jgi:hypothetical protein
MRPLIGLTVAGVVAGAITAGTIFVNGASSAPQADLGAVASTIQHEAGADVLEIRASATSAGSFDAVTETEGVFADLRFSSAGQLEPIPTREVPNWMLRWRRRTELSRGVEPLGSIVSAIKVAQRTEHAQAADAALLQPGRYDVEVMRGGKPSHVIVDAYAGRVLYQGSAATAGHSHA